MVPALAWMEQTPLSVFMREDFYAYFVALIGHAVGMAMLVGGGLAAGLRGLGVMGPGLADKTDIARWRAVLPVMRWGAVLAIVSGLALLAGYPAKALTNPVFAIKFACLIGAAWLTMRMLRGDGPSRMQAAGAIALWLGAIAAGKLLLYTNSILMTAELLP